MNLIFYFCDRKKCERCNRYCLYTTDPEHALDKDAWPFVRDGAGDWEQTTENTYSYDGVKAWTNATTDNRPGENV